MDKNQLQKYAQGFVESYLILSTELGDQKPARKMLDQVSELFLDLLRDGQLTNPLVSGLFGGAADPMNCKTGNKTNLVREAFGITKHGGPSAKKIDGYTLIFEFYSPIFVGE